MRKPAPYNEELLHWIWANHQLAHKPLHTLAGDPVIIHELGRPNQSDGPDFLNARITIGNLVWHGDVEMHWSARDWHRHEHHTDPNYNQVILHVIFYEDSASTANRPDKTPLPTLCLQPYLKQPLKHFFEKFSASNGLPCTASLPHISNQVFERQIDKAHIQYFEQKTNDLLSYYKPGLPLSRAWQQMVIIALFDGLGIAHNRAPMRQLAEVLLKQHHITLPSQKELITQALREAGLQPLLQHTAYGWKRKGSRPVNHPEVRIPQACQLLWIITKTPFSNWLQTGIRRSYENCISHITTTPALGKQRAAILYGTVWIPAHYILGELLSDKKRTSESYELWLHNRTKLPKAVTKPFRHTSIPSSVYQGKLGTVYQFRHFCKPRHCHKCKVFKNIISA